MQSAQGQHVKATLHESWKIWFCKDPWTNTLLESRPVAKVKYVFVEHLVYIYIYILKKTGWKMLTKWDICFTSVVNTWGYMGIYHVRALHGACKNKYLSRWFWFYIHSNTTINRTCVKKLPMKQWRQLQKCTMCTWRIWCLLELWLLHANIIYIYIFLYVYIYCTYIIYTYIL